MLPLRIAVTLPNGHAPTEGTAKSIAKTLSCLLTPADTWESVSVAHASQFDAAVVWCPCGHADAASSISKIGVPTLPLNPNLCYHPYFAAFNREVEDRGGLLLPHDDPTELAGSVRALRARKQLRRSRLLVIDDHAGDGRAERIRSFADSVRKSMGVEITHLPVDDLLRQAAALDQDRVRSEWSRLQAELLDLDPELSDKPWDAHFHQVARLYVALRDLLVETGSSGVTVDDIGAFLQGRKGQSPAGVMPNVAYGALASEGYLACEEGDIEALTTELLLQAGTGAHPTMSNVYLAYRDRFDALDGAEGYTPEMEREDFEQCRRDNLLVIAHFSTSGILPPDMRIESRILVRETLPAWPGQSMVQCTPRLGQVTLARLSADAARLHHLPGEIVEVKQDDTKGWYRGRWYVRIESVRSFIESSRHQHYVIGPRGDDSAFRALRTLLRFE